MADRAELLFSEVLNALSQIAQKKFGKEAPLTTNKIPEQRHQTIELEGMLQKERAEFEVTLPLCGILPSVNSH